MKLVACIVPQALGAPVKYRLKDVHSGIVYPNLLNAEQISSPSVQAAATTYINMQMQHTTQMRLHLCALPPLFLSMLNLTGFTGRPPADSAEPETALEVGERQLLLDKISQLKRTIIHLEERNDRQARIIKAVQGSVRGDVQ